jgi:hypothetical protein
MSSVVILAIWREKLIRLILRVGNGPMLPGHGVGR